MLASSKLTAFNIERALRRMAGADHICASGEYGRIIGSIHDRAILEKYASSKTWCPIENQFFVDFFAGRAAGTYLDIGANIGLTTIPVARNPAISCLAFEPEPLNFGYLQKNVRRHCGTNVRLFQLALSDRSGDLELRLSPTNKGDHRLTGGHEEGLADGTWPVIRVETKRLDDFVSDQKIVPPVAAKIVAQGSELHILAGGRTTLSAAEALVIEFYPHLLALAAPAWDSFYSFLNENFDRSALTVGGQRSEPWWQSMAEVISSLQTMMRTTASRSDLYFHVFLSK
jgi:FkbM family methyltransferase